jgi:hypothetical protein
MAEAEPEAPKLLDSPGHVLVRRGKDWSVRWQAQSDLVERGYLPKSIRIAVIGDDPSDAERAFISDQCKLFQTDMLTWEQSNPPEGPSTSDSDKSDDFDWEEGIRATQELHRNLPLRTSNAAVGLPGKPVSFDPSPGQPGYSQDLRKDIAKAIDKTPEKPPLSNHEHHPTTKTLDYLGLGVILAPAPEVIAMYLRHEDIDWQRVAISFLASTIIGSAILWFAHGWRKPVGALAALRGRINRADDYFAVRAAIIAFFMIAPVLIAPLVSGTSSTPSAQPGFTQEQVDTKIATAVAAAITNLNSQLAEANRRRDAALREADTLRQQVQNPPPQPPTPEDQTPVNWQPDFQISWYVDQKIVWIRFIGVATDLAHIKDAYIISNLTGHKEQLDIANPANFAERWKVDQVEPVPSGAQIILVYEPKPSPPLPDFLSQWGAFELHVVYDHKEYVKAYSQGFINSKLAREMPGFGPHVTRKNDK